MNGRAKYAKHLERRYEVSSEVRLHRRDARLSSVVARFSVLGNISPAIHGWASGGATRSEFANNVMNRRAIHPLRRVRAKPRAQGWVRPTHFRARRFIVACTCGRKVTE